RTGAEDLVVFPAWRDKSRRESAIRSGPLLLHSAAIPAFGTLSNVSRSAPTCEVSLVRCVPAALTRYACGPLSRRSSLQRSSPMTTVSPSGSRVAKRHWLMVGAVLLMSVGSVNRAVAQSVSSGTIEGTVKDESGSVLPGATITATSPQLQVGQIVQVSDSS